MLTLKPLSIDRSVAGAKIPAVVFIAHTGLATHELAHMLDSLVRVSRRVEQNHLVNILVSGKCPRPQRRQEGAEHSLSSKCDGTLQPDTHASVHTGVLPDATTHPQASYHAPGVIL